MFVCLLKKLKIKVYSKFIDFKHTQAFTLHTPHLQMGCNHSHFDEGMRKCEEDWEKKDELSKGPPPPIFSQTMDESPKWCVIELFNLFV